MALPPEHPSYPAIYQKRIYMEKTKPLNLKIQVHMYSALAHAAHILGRCPTDIVRDAIWCWLEDNDLLIKKVESIRPKIEMNDE